jgi:hypothetical protein
VAGLAGEAVGKGEGLTHNRFVAADGRRGARSWPAGGAQGTRPRRLCSGGPPVWEEARAAQVGCRGRVEMRGGGGLRRNGLEEGAPRWGAQAGPPACDAACAVLVDVRPL